MPGKLIPGEEKTPVYKKSGPFKLRSGNTTPFKQMGSSPAKDILTGRKRIYDPKTNTTKIYNRKGELIKTKHHDKKTEKEMAQEKEKNTVKKEQVEEKKVEDKVEKEETKKKDIKKDIKKGIREKIKKEGPKPPSGPTPEEMEEEIVINPDIRTRPGFGLDR